MALELKYEFSEIEGNTSFVIKDTSTPSFTQTGWNEGTNPDFADITSVEKFNLILPDETEVDLSTQWQEVIDNATVEGDLYLIVTSDMLGLGEDELLDDGIYTLEVEYDVTGETLLQGTTSTFILTGRLENVIYTLIADIPNYYNLGTTEAKTYMDNIIIAYNLLDTAKIAVNAAKFQEAEDIIDTLNGLLEKFE